MTAMKAQELFTISERLWVVPHVGACHSGLQIDYCGPIHCGVKRCGWTPFSGRLQERNHYEDVIRNDKDLHAIRDYIETNPSQSVNDPEKLDYNPQGDQR